MGWNPTSMPRVETRSPSAGLSPAPSPCGPEAAPAATGTVDPLSTGAPAGRVAVRVESIRAERKDEFERLLRDVIAPAVERNGEHAGACVRTLAPSAANHDGSWSYLVVHDAAVVDTDAGRRRLLEREYGAEAAAEHERRYAECRCGDAITFGSV